MLSRTSSIWSCSTVTMGVRTPSTLLFIVRRLWRCSHSRCPRQWYAKHGLHHPPLVMWWTGHREPPFPTPLTTSTIQTTSSSRTCARLSESSGSSAPSLWPSWRVRPRRHGPWIRASSSLTGASTYQRHQHCSPTFCKSYDAEVPPT